MASSWPDDSGGVGYVKKNAVTDRRAKMMPDSDSETRGPRAVRAVARSGLSGPSRLRYRFRHQQPPDALTADLRDSGLPICAGHIVIRHADEVVADHEVCPAAVSASPIGPILPARRS